jgi:hypothetical protein
MEEQQGTFKVTDRRLFNSDGSPREVPVEEKSEIESKPQATEPVSETAAQATSERVSESAADDDEEFAAEDIPDAHDPAGFVNFAMFVASNAASALGMTEHPVSHKREVDLELGKHWIDVLGMLERKTKGNLSAAEAKILENWLADLRMQYVSLTNSSAKATSQYSGRDIVGGK